MFPKFSKHAVGRFMGVLAAFCLCGCITSDDRRVYDGSRLADAEELLADDLTIFTTSIMAFDTPSKVTANTPALYERFLNGNDLYKTPRIANTTDTAGMSAVEKANLKRYRGLGPLYTGLSCAGCHWGAGRTMPTLHTDGGTGKSFSTFLVFLKSRNGQVFEDYGRVLHDHALSPEKPEGRLAVTYSEECRVFPTPDREMYCLITPRYSITDWYPKEIPPEELVMSVRTPLRHVGQGLMMAVDREEIKKLASRSYEEFGISGEINWIVERGVRGVGLSGHKAHHLDLTVELGFFSSMGVTNERFPYEVGEGQPQVTRNFGIEISTLDMADVEFYLHNLGVPARRNANDPQVLRGEQMFYKAKCHLCHVPTLHTGPSPPELMDGTLLPHLANKTIHPYSDYLVHDMGPELGDDYDQGNASGDEWRTTPLWGIGMQEAVSGHTYFLHDSRARNYVEAIMWHGGEGEVSRKIFKHMPKVDRDALIVFLKSL